MIIIPRGTCRTLNNYTCSYGGVILCHERLLRVLLPLLPGLEAGFQLVAPFGFQSRRVAALRAVGRSSDQLSGASLRSRTNRAVFRCVQADPPAVCSLSSAHSFSRSFRPVAVWRFGAACVEMLETVAPLK